MKFIRQDETDEVSVENNEESGLGKYDIRSTY